MNLTTIKQLATRALITAVHVLLATLIAGTQWNVSAVRAAAITALAAGVSVVWNGLSAAGVPLPSTINTGALSGEAKKLAAEIAAHLPKHAAVVTASAPVTVSTGTPVVAASPAPSAPAAPAAPAA